MIHRLWETLQLDSRNLAGAETKQALFSCSLLDTASYLPVFSEVFRILIIVAWQDHKRKAVKTRIFGGKKRKNMLTVSWLKYFLKMSHNLDVNLSLSLHLIIISSGQPFNSYNVNHAAVTDEIHTCIQFCAWKRRRKCRPFATPIFLREIQLFAVSLP